MFFRHEILRFLQVTFTHCSSAIGLLIQSQTDHCETACHPVLSSRADGRRTQHCFAAGAALSSELPLPYWGCLANTHPHTASRQGRHCPVSSRERPSRERPYLWMRRQYTQHCFAAGAALSTAIKHQHHAITCFVAALVGGHREEVGRRRPWRHDGV